MAKRILTLLASALALIVLLHVWRVISTHPITTTTTVAGCLLSFCLLAPTLAMWALSDVKTRDWMTYATLLACIGIETALTLR